MTEWMNNTIKIIIIFSCIIEMYFVTKNKQKKVTVN